MGLDGGGAAALWQGGVNPFFLLLWCPTSLEGFFSGSLVFAGWVFPSTSWRSHLSVWEGKALHRQRKE